jgi:hypothetical protein
MQTQTKITVSKNQIVKFHFGSEKLFLYMQTLECIHVVADYCED